MKQLLGVKQERGNMIERKHKRFTAKHGVYASILQENHKLGQIVDVSKGGLSFKYIDQHSEQMFGSEDKENLTLSSNHYIVEKLPFNVVDEYEVKEASFCNTSIKKIHIEFQTLTPRQEFLLNDFIAECCLGEKKV